MGGCCRFLGAEGAIDRVDRVDSFWGLLGKKGHLQAGWSLPCSREGRRGTCRQAGRSPAAGKGEGVLAARLVAPLQQGREKGYLQADERDYLQIVWALSCSRLRALLQQERRGFLQQGRENCYLQATLELS